jgi:curved DNA-binding protein
MQNFRNYYDILGVDRDVPNEDIKRIYRQLARRYHPDVNPGNKAAEDRFKDINEAYEVLSDPERRRQYDQYGQFWKQKGFQNGQARRPWSSWGTSEGRDTTSAAEDLDVSKFRDFNTFVDELLNRHKPAWGSTHEQDWENLPPPPSRRLDRPEMPPWRPTPGEREWSQAEPSRPVGESQRAQTAFVETPPRPRDVEAQLTVPLEKAYTGGRERIRLEDGRMLEVVMPAGMVTGQKVRLREQGVAGGDLYLRIDVAPHRFFRLDGVDIYCQVPITPAEAVLGGSIELPTLDGRVKMNLPQPVRSGQRLRLAKKGYPDGAGDRGDQIIEILIQFPTTLSDQERELYEQLRQIETNPRATLT